MKKDLIIVFAVIILAALVVFTTNFQSVDDYYLSHIEDITPSSQTVTLEIKCDDVPSGITSVSENGVLLPAASYVLREGDTVFDILTRVAKAKRLQLDYIPQSGYVKGIEYIYEFECGPLSGWVYTVNGESPVFAANECTLNDGDFVCWQYYCGGENS